MFSSNKKIEINCISEIRGLLMGMATILVLLFHSPLIDFGKIFTPSIATEILNFIKTIGNCGVDLFLFISSIGLYFSFSKNNIKTFYKNRFLKIMPSLIFVNYIYFGLVKKLTLREICSKIFFIDLFTKGDRTSWYFTLIIILYLVYPLIHKLIEKLEIKGVILLINFIIVSNLLINICFPYLYYNIEIALTRIPVFILGAYFGNLSIKKIIISKEAKTLSFLIYFLILILLYILIMKIKVSNIAFLIRYLYCPLAITTSINVAYCHQFFKNKLKILTIPIIFIGKYSMEFYLLYEKIVSELISKIKTPSYLSTYFIIFIITFSLAILLQIIMKTIINLISSIYKKCLLNKNA